jgi:hypothetical protein
MPSTLNQTAPAPAVMSPAGVGAHALIRTSSRFVSGSSLDTDPSYRFCTHTASSPTVMNFGDGPTGIRATTRFVDGSIRTTVFSALLETHTLPNPATATSDRAPVASLASIAPERTFNRTTEDELVSLALSGIHRLPLEKAIAPSRPPFIGAGSLRMIEFSAGSISLMTPS